MVSGSQNKKVTYWDLESFEAISQSPILSGVPNIIDFYDEEKNDSAVEWVVAAGDNSMRCVNVEHNVMGDQFKVAGEISDMSIYLRH